MFLEVINSRIKIFSKTHNSQRKAHNVTMTSQNFELWRHWNSRITNSEILFKIKISRKYLENFILNKNFEFVFHSIVWMQPLYELYLSTLSAKT